MIPYIDRLLDLWARWQRKGPAIHLDYPRNSPIHTMMTTNAATTDKSRHRRKRTWIVVGGVLVERHTEHARGVETRPATAFNEPERPLELAVDEAVCLLNTAIRHSVELHYLRQFNYERAAREQKICVSTFKIRLKCAHYSLDGWLRARHPELLEIDRVTAE